MEDSVSESFQVGLVTCFSMRAVLHPVGLAKHPGSVRCPLQGGVWAKAMVVSGGHVDTRNATAKQVGGCRLPLICRKELCCASSGDMLGPLKVSSSLWKE